MYIRICHLYPLIARSLSLSLYAFFYSMHFTFSFFFLLTHFTQLHYISPLSDFFYSHLFPMFRFYSRISLPLPTFYFLFYSLFTSFFPFPPVFLPSQKINFMNNIRHRFEVRESHVNHQHHGHGHIECPTINGHSLLFF